MQKLQPGRGRKMISCNNTYFDKTLRQDGHYIVVGNTNDRFCSDALQLTDVSMELHRYLRYEQGFDVVILFDGINVLFTYDEQSFDVLSGKVTPEKLLCSRRMAGEGTSGAFLVCGNTASAPDETVSGGTDSGNAEIAATGPLGGRRRHRRNADWNGQPTQDSPMTPVQRSQTPLHMNRMNLEAAWQQVTAILRDSELSCALLLANVNSLQHSLGTHELQVLEELSSYHNCNSNIVVYLFRDTTLANVLVSAQNGSGPWSTFVKTVLEPRISTEDAEANRVITLGMPNQKEIGNLLNYLRIRETVRMEAGEIRALGETLSASCARQRLRLRDLHLRLETYQEQHPGEQLSKETWRSYAGEPGYRPALERLERMIGMDTLKQDIRDWYALQQGALQNRPKQPVVSSRFAPSSFVNENRGHMLNICLKGEPGTGKTTVARLFGELYRDLHLLPQGQFVPCTAADLISPYVGETPQRVREWVQQAVGGVLFVDEAYALMNEQNGTAAIDQLVNEMSSYEGQFAMILAGYPNQMDELMRSNDGLARRFPNEYVLPSYTSQELKQIFFQMMKSDPEHLYISDELSERLDDFFEAWAGGRTRDWGNAGECEKLLTNMKKACSARMQAEYLQTGQGAQTGAFASEGLVFTTADIPAQLSHCLKRRSHSLEEAFAEIDQMIGLKNVKRYLKDLSQGVLWGEEGCSPGNFIFYGPPGSGKTMIARKIGEIFGLLGMLRRKTNNVVECRAADLLSGAKTLEREVENARGGIFFLDEAHQLEQSDCGRAIIRALVPMVEDPEIRMDTCFICAGYAADMRKFLAVDPGLERRFPDNRRIRFYDYTAEELVQILALMAKERGEIATEAYLMRSRSALERFLEEKPKDFGNGGFIREVYLPESIAARTRRLNLEATGAADGIVKEEQVHAYSKEARHTLTAEDIPASFVQLAGPAGQRPQAPRNAETLLGELIGKQEIVDYVRARAQEIKERAQGGGRSGQPVFYDRSRQTGLNFAVAGPTGSGRHTVVKAMAVAWQELGLLESGDVLFIGKGDLEAGFVGQTKIKTREVIEQALGKTLCVQYPSEMLPKNAHDNSYGPDALGEIFSAMSCHRSELSVVFLDTKDGMDALMRATPGLASGLTAFTLEDLLPQEMEQLFHLKVDDGMVFEEELTALLPDFFLNWVSDRGGLGDALRSWGNGAELDLLAEELRRNWQLQNGTAVTETVQENGAAYTISRRKITKEMMPQHLVRYLKESRVVSETAMQELERMTGMRTVKEFIRKVERRLRRLKGGHTAPGCYCFIGNPGVGKTTAAKLMGGVLRAAGALSQGHVIVRTARQMCDAVEEFDDILRLAKNGILFIDEAHQLAEYGNLRGDSVIKRLLTVLEDTEVMKDTCIILAGYPREMKALLDADNGLASRFGTKDSMILFEDYTAQELLEILDHMAEDAHRIAQIGAAAPLQPNEAYRAASLRIFRSVCAAGDPNFGNARFVRNYLHDSLDELLERLDEQYGSEDEIPEEALTVLTEADIPKNYRTAEKKKAKMVRFPETAIKTLRRDTITNETYDTACEALSQHVVLLETYCEGRKAGEGTGTIVTKDGHVLTCAHVVQNADRIRARVYAPGMVGGDYRWFECEILDPIQSDCDMAVLKMNGTNFHPVSIRSADESIWKSEETVLLGYPLGAMLTGNQADSLRISHFAGRIASAQEVHGTTRYYVDTTGLHGNSGSPVFSRNDGRMIGVFSGSIIPRTERSLDELNYFYPTTYFWERFVQRKDSEEQPQQEGAI